ncbi:acyl carrier protein [Alishewanella tabrizica]|uniref:Carrier domain-containing protein n=1 Tax=Alishewanella tabrizica TaxID=671278 RepID=A0ABQ2WLN2_9ALTE|nr:acyl carrier protein [Alishewanella tabrizica]GGW62809.1 hypothetical protein GCM10008111_18460 [Alishewanella tabrizica]
MPTELILTKILNSVLALEQAYVAETRLLGAIPEFDSMAIIAIITLIEEQLGIIFSDDELTAENFETFDSLNHLIQNKLQN